jgi:hypothetical protein
MGNGGALGLATSMKRRIMEVRKPESVEMVKYQKVSGEQWSESVSRRSSSLKA